MPKGFTDKVKTVVAEMDLPFKIKEVRRAKDPRNAVVNGCLAQALVSQKRLKKENKE